MATEKQILNRINSTVSIEKITKSMKMVSASKLRGDQQRLALARPFVDWTTRVFGEPIMANPEEREEEQSVPMNGQNLVVAVTSDRGLCGGVNSFCSKATAALANEIQGETGEAPKVYVFGDKGRPQMRRLAGEFLVGSASDVSRNPFNFTQVCAMTEELLKLEHDTVQIVFNKFQSAISYDTSILAMARPVAPTEPGEGEEPMVEYEFEPENKDEALVDMYEYGLATALYGACIEAATAEQSARMTAMENASKNAGELIDSLTLQYNRARQSRITTELIEIISGASALETAD